MKTNPGTSPARERKRATSIAALMLSASMTLGQTSTAKPVFILHPQSVMVLMGDTLRLTCLATGTAPIAYIWQKDGGFLGDQTDATLLITNAQASDAGRYAAIASNDYGLERTGAAEVTVCTNQTCNFPWVWEARLRIPEETSWLTEVSDMAVDAAGNILATGDSGDNCLTAKYDSSGRLLWTAIYSGPGNQSQSAQALALDTQGNCYVTGYAYSLKQPMESDNDYVTLKYDRSGHAAWTNQWNSDASRRSWDMAYAVAVDEAGQSYVMGTGGLIKLSADGTLVWSNTVCQGEAVKLKVAGDALYATIGKTAAWSSKLFRVDTNGALL